MKNEKVFLHLCCSRQCADKKMKEFVKFLQFSTGFALSYPAKLIATDDLNHIFKTPDALAERRLDGLNIVGWDGCAQLELPQRHLDYLKAIIQT